MGLSERTDCHNTWHTELDVALLPGRGQEVSKSETSEPHVRIG
jgi:hypothetical protein